MAEKIKTTLPPSLDLSGQYVIEWDAVDPVTGASVAGVNVSDTSLLVGGTFGSGGEVAGLGPWFLVPGPGA